MHLWQTNNLLLGETFPWILEFFVFRFEMFLWLEQRQGISTKNISIFTSLNEFSAFSFKSCTTNSTLSHLYYKSAIYFITRILKRFEAKNVCFVHRKLRHNAWGLFRHKMRHPFSYAYCWSTLFLLNNN